MPRRSLRWLRPARRKPKKTARTERVYQDTFLEQAEEDPVSGVKVAQSSPSRSRR